MEAPKTRGKEHRRTRTDRWNNLVEKRDMMSAYHVRHRIVEAVVALSQGQEVGEPRREHQLVHARIRETPVYGLNVDAVDALSL